MSAAARFEVMTSALSAELLIPRLVTSEAVAAQASTTTRWSADTRA
jgi:hypothetical protein